MDSKITFTWHGKTYDDFDDMHMDVIRDYFTPTDLVALTSSISGTGETTEVDAHCLLTRDGRAAMVDDFFNRLWNQVANAAINCYI